MPNEDNKILIYNHREKSVKVPFIIYADLECLLEKMPSCQNNPEKFYTEKKIKHTPFDYSLFINCKTCLLQRYKLYGKVLQRLMTTCNENN